MTAGEAGGGVGFCGSWLPAQEADRGHRTDGPTEEGERRLSRGARKKRTGPVTVSCASRGGQEAKEVGKLLKERRKLVADAKERVAQVSGGMEEVSREAVKARAKAEEAKNEFEQDGSMQKRLEIEGFAQFR